MMDTTSRPKEYRLAVRAQSGDPEALAALVEQARAPLFALAYAELRHYEDAQDAVASALLHICRHVHDLREPERVLAWMRTIVRNEAHRLRRLRRPESSLDGGGDEIPVRDDEESALLRLDVERLMRQMPREEAQAFALFYLPGLSIREIAERTGRPEGTIKRWLHSGRRRLATRLEGYYAAPAAAADASTTPLTATLISTDLEPAEVENVRHALREAGFAAVETLSDVPPLFSLEGTPPPPLLTGKRLVILDEQIGGRSAFEVYAELKAHKKTRDTWFCLLLSSPSDETVFAAWEAGFDLCFNKECLGPRTFRHCIQRAVMQRSSDSRVAARRRYAAARSENEPCRFW